MIFYIRVPDEPQKKAQNNGLLNGLEDFYDLATYNVIAVVTDGNEHLHPLLGDIAEHTRITEAESILGAIRRKNLLPAEPAEIPPPDPKPETKNGAKPAKICQECSEPHHRRSKFCSSACYQRDWYRRNQKAEQESEPARKPNGGPTVIVSENRQASGRRITGKKLA